MEQNNAYSNSPNLILIKPVFCGNTFILVRSTFEECTHRSRWSLNMKLGVTQRWYGRCVAEKNIVTLTGIELRASMP